MIKWRITYIDGTFEDVKGYHIDIYNNVLSIRLDHDTAYNPRFRSWPLTALRSWEQLRD